MAINYIFAGSLRVAQEKGSTITYFHKDHLGSSTVMTNASGLEVESTDYMPFGGIRNHTGTNTSNYKFTDQELDAENGLYNYNARLYDPIIGRFISADPIVPEPYNPQSLNRYSYCLNNPLIYVDPSGYEGKNNDPAVIVLEEIVVIGVRTAPYGVGTALMEYLERQRWIQEQIQKQTVYLLQWINENILGHPENVPQGGAPGGSAGDSPYTETERKDVCRKAKEKGLVNKGDLGGIVIKNGVPYPCAWNNPSWPAADILTRNIMREEEGHIKRGEFMFEDGKDFYRAGLPASGWYEAEIPARTESVKALQMDKIRCYDDNRTEPIDKCLSAIDWYIFDTNNKIKSIKQDEEYQK